jgi:hypothetical protein
VVPSEGIVAVRMGTAPPPAAPFTQAELDHGRARRAGRPVTDLVDDVADAYVWGHPLVTMHRTRAAHGGGRRRPSRQPAPRARGPFVLMLRLYLPGEAILEGEYAYPPVEPIDTVAQRIG